MRLTNSQTQTKAPTIKNPDLVAGDQNPPEILVKRDKVNVDSFKRIIRDMSLKVTDQRMAILEALSRGRAHVTAQEVYEAVYKEDSSIGFATVYRFLRNLTEHKFVTEVRMGGLPARYELTPKNHHDHLTCTECGRIIEFENHEIEALQEKVAKYFGFKLTGHVLELYGQCLDAKCELRKAKKTK
jgi:Fur family transcriptional regulator, ferric uptake regulator